MMKLFYMSISHDNFTIIFILLRIITISTKVVGFILSDPYLCHSCHYKTDEILSLNKITTKSF